MLAFYRTIRGNMVRVKILRTVRDRNFYGVEVKVTALSYGHIGYPHGYTFDTSALWIYDRKRRRLTMEMIEKGLGENVG
jgi:hypothetical protein